MYQGGKALWARPIKASEVGIRNRAELFGWQGHAIFLPLAIIEWICSAQRTNQRNLNPESLPNEIPE
jgi:hypothetical protein